MAKQDGNLSGILSEESRPLEQKELKLARPHVPVSPRQTSQLRTEFESLVGAHAWGLIDQLPEADVDLFVIDCLHKRDPEAVLVGIKQLLLQNPETVFLFLVNSAARLQVPGYLGQGKALSLRQGLETERDDSALLNHSRRLFPKYALEDLILTPRTNQKLKEAINYVRHKSFCENDWGFKKRHSRGHGVTLVFHGPSGTGKTMAAEVVASTLGLPLYQIDLSSVVSKWIGETEKNLKSIFRSARGVNGILLFDEGDAIFGTRTEVKGSSDKYANLEVNYLLQELEAFEGIVILSTNHQRNMDEAFLRRFTYAICFGQPGLEERKRIWKVNVPSELPLAPDVDFSYLGRFPLTGGNIRNIVRDAAALAATSNKRVVSLFEFMWAMKRELSKKNQMLTREDLGEHMWRLVGSEWEDEPILKRLALAEKFSLQKGTASFS